MKYNKIAIDPNKVYTYNSHVGSLGKTIKGVVHFFELPCGHGFSSCGEIAGHLDANSNPIDDTDYYLGRNGSRQREAKLLYYVILGAGTCGSNYAYDDSVTREGMSWNDYADKVEQYNPGFKKAVQNLHGREYDYSNW